MQQPCSTLSIAHPLILSIGFLMLIAAIIILYRWHQAERKLHEYHETFRADGYELELSTNGYALTKED